MRTEHTRTNLGCEDRTGWITTVNDAAMVLNEWWEPEENDGGRGWARERLDGVFHNVSSNKTVEIDIRLHAA